MSIEELEDAIVDLEQAYRDGDMSEEDFEEELVYLEALIEDQETK
jgi:hypothetical protein